MDKHYAAVVELLVGHGIDLDVIDERGLTALHIVLQGRQSVVGIPEDSPELNKVCTLWMLTVRPLLVCVQ